jgi:cytochrome d ubiquinol oxidase subunit II
MGTEVLLAGVMVGALVLYALMGGADFGGGVWDLLARGPRRKEQRALIEEALGPIWETNHVWLIVVVVVLFSAFPPAFSALSIGLHVPLTLLLVGIVFRGSAFTFRSYDSREDRKQRRWGLMFSLASIVSPVLLGMVVGTIASGGVRVRDGEVTSGYFTWLSPFPAVVGLFTLAIFALLAATYLANEAGTPELRDDFRARALGAGVAVGVLALVTFVLAGDAAPLIRQGLTARPWTWPLHLATGGAALTAFWSLWRGRFRLARLAVAAQATLILLGWAVSQYPYLVVPDLTLQGAAANPLTRKFLLWALGAGMALLLPCLYVLYSVFKGQKRPEVLDRQRDHRG